jgi:hypothetical protein
MGEAKTIFAAIPSGFACAGRRLDHTHELNHKGRRPNRIRLRHSQSASAMRADSDAFTDLAADSPNPKDVPTLTTLVVKSARSIRVRSTQHLGHTGGKNFPSRFRRDREPSAFLFPQNRSFSRNHSPDSQVPNDSQSAAQCPADGYLLRTSRAARALRLLARLQLRPNAKKC